MKFEVSKPTFKLAIAPNLHERDRPGFSGALVGPELSEEAW